MSMRSRLGQGLGIAAALVLATTTGCVTKGNYEAMVSERDALDADRAALQGQVAELAFANEELAKLIAEREETVTELQRDMVELRGNYDGLIGELKSELESGQVQLERLKNGIRLNVSDEILFPSGSAELDDEGRELLVKVSEQIRGRQDLVEVEGHTDNVPIATNRFPTNWELAAARAARVVRLLQEQGVDGTRLRAVSNAEYHPVAPNDSDEGRAKNRRIGIRLIPTDVTAASPDEAAEAAQEETADVAEPTGAQDESAEGETPEAEASTPAVSAPEASPEAPSKN